MKLPTEIRTFCPHCRSHQVMSLKIEKPGRRGAGGQKLAVRRQIRHRKGTGNKGKYSKKPITQNKMASKTTKKTDVRLKCKKCGKSITKSFPRAKKVEVTAQ